MVGPVAAPALAAALLVVPSGCSEVFGYRSVAAADAVVVDTLVQDWRGDLPAEAALFDLRADGDALPDVSLLAVADTQLEETGVPGGGADRFKVGSMTGTQRIALVRFDLEEVPAGQSIRRAVLRLCIIEQPQAESVGTKHDMHRVTSAWDEMAVTWATSPTWADKPSSTFEVPAATGCLAVDVTMDVHTWLAGTPNHGWSIRNPDPDIPNVRYASREHNVTEYRPGLDLYY